ncbi:SDR family oxidoreductase [Marinobacter sp. HN1S83]|uniref:SDR family oxidoreductase n=1 Tax=Marinobacter sp. HN1S83 TaxID=3382301 RepID=UPI00387B5678
MTLFITGATGFIGRHVCAQLTRSHDLCAVLRQPESQLPILRRQVNALGGQGDRLHAVQGDLDLPGLGLPEDLPASRVIIHLGARFAWQLAPATAHRTNVAGSLAVAELARRHHSRLVFISGFMLENQDHLLRLGINDDNPERVNWRRVYRRAGGYEASKLEAAIRVRALAAESDLDVVEVQPATVAGHSHTGALDPSQPLFALLDNLARGRMAMIPGSPDHWLPLVAVDHLASLIAVAATSDNAPKRLLALDPTTPNLQGMLAIAADLLGRRAPQRHLPIPVLAALLHLPGLPRLMNTWPEALHFIQPTRFDTASTDAFLREQGLARPPMEAVIAASARWYQQCRRNPPEPRPA